MGSVSLRRGNSAPGSSDFACLVCVERCSNVSFSFLVQPQFPLSSSVSGLRSAFVGMCADDYRRFSSNRRWRRCRNHLSSPCQDPDGEEADPPSAHPQCQTTQHQTSQHQATRTVGHAICAVPLPGSRNCTEHGGSDLRRVPGHVARPSPECGVV